MPKTAADTFSLIPKPGKSGCPIDPEPAVRGVMRERQQRPRPCPSQSTHYCRLGAKFGPPAAVRRQTGCSRPFTDTQPPIFRSQLLPVRFLIFDAQDGPIPEWRLTGLDRQMAVRRLRFSASPTEEIFCRSADAPKRVIGLEKLQRRSAKLTSCDCEFEH